MSEQNHSVDFETFWKHNYHSAYRFAMRLTRNPEDALDVTQEAFIRAYRAFDKRDPSWTGAAWLFQVLFRVFLDHLRARRRRPQTTSLNALQEDTGFEVADPQSESDLIIESEFSAPLSQAFTKLTSTQQDMLRDVLAGQSYDAMAQAYRCGPTTIKTKIHRARVALKRHLMAIDPEFATIRTTYLAGA